jgi:hypothetical protein
VFRSSSGRECRAIVLATAINAIELAATDGIDWATLKLVLKGMGNTCAEYRRQGLWCCSLEVSLRAALLPGRAQPLPPAPAPRAAASVGHPPAPRMQNAPASLQ